MDTNLLLDVSPAALAAFCERWRIRELSLFGSALRGESRADSDVDLLVTFHDEAAWGLLDLSAMEIELEELIGRPVDLVERRGLEQSANWIRRDEILRTARPMLVTP